jgi:hypothetical protein
MGWEWRGNRWHTQPEGAGKRWLLLVPGRVTGRWSLVVGRSSLVVGNPARERLPTNDQRLTETEHIAGTYVTL